MTSRWWTKEKNKVRCRLCPHQCLIRPGDVGICGTRRASANGLELPGWGRITAEAVDPVEKKPLYHFMPGNTVYSAGFAGCNLDCPFCQNHRIARAPPGTGIFHSPEELIDRALQTGAGMMAYTYSEPTIHGEYIIETAQKARKRGLRNILVTNGCVEADPARKILDTMDAVNVDLKSFSSRYYRATLRGRLETVKDFIAIAAERCWTEVTTLIVPDDNDGENAMDASSQWLSSISPQIPLHLSAYHPSHRYTRAPTSAQTVMRLAEVARLHLDYVYLGNLGRENDTVCPECSFTVIQRRGYATINRLNRGKCPECRHHIPGIFS